VSVAAIQRDYIAWPGREELLQFTLNASVSLSFVMIIISLPSVPSLSRHFSFTSALAWGQERCLRIQLQFQVDRLRVAFVVSFIKALEQAIVITYVQVLACSVLYSSIHATALNHELYSRYKIQFDNNVSADCTRWTRCTYFYEWF
jgi:hypothetical protein